MSYRNYTVVLNFSDGTYNYDLPYVFSISDPEPAGKDVVIEGNRADGCIVIPGGKKSVEIVVKGKLFDEDGYDALATKIATMKTSVTRATATLTLKHQEIGGGWTTDWAYTVKRVGEIGFPESLRTGVQEYNVTFLVKSY